MVVVVQVYLLLIQLLGIGLLLRRRLVVDYCRCDLLPVAAWLYDDAANRLQELDGEVGALVALGGS